MTQLAAARFNRQPAHVLMVDISQPFNHDALVNVYQSATDFLALVTHMSGPLRVPFFGLTVIGEYAETIFPLQPVKGNFARFYSLITEFKKSAMDNPMPAFMSESFSQGFQDIVSQFRRQQQAFRQVTNSPCQLEISILTCQPARNINEQVTELSQTLDLNCLKKVQILNLRIREVVQNELFMESPDDKSEPSSETFSHIVDVISLENDVLCMMNYFKSWLTDCGNDCESIHIILPTRMSSSPDLLGNEMNSNGNEMLLKCDLHEVSIDPMNLLNGEFFNLRGECNAGKYYSQLTKSPSLTSQCSNRIRRLKAFALVKTAGVCESVLYGMPMFVRPTCCWKLDWDDLESNQRDFNSLCKVLNDKNLSLILKAETVDNSRTTYPQAYYLVMASSNSTLLIKSLAMEELMLPSTFPSFSEKASQESTERIKDSLDKLPVHSVYNPFFTKSNLFKFLISKTLNNNPGLRGNKRKYQTAQRTQEIQGRPSNLVNDRLNQATTRQTSKRVTFQSPLPAQNQDNISRSPVTQKRSRVASTVAVMRPNA